MCCRKTTVFLRHFLNAKVQPFFIQANKHQFFFDFISAFLSSLQRLKYKIPLSHNKTNSFTNHPTKVSQENGGFSATLYFYTSGDQGNMKAEEPSPATLNQGNRPIVGEQKRRCVIIRYDTQRTQIKQLPINLFGCTSIIRGHLLLCDQCAILYFDSPSISTL